MLPTILTYLDEGTMLLIIHLISRLGKELIQNVVDITLSQDMFSNPDLSQKNNSPNYTIFIFGP